MSDQKFKKLFAACKTQNVKKASMKKQSGGSYASDSVTGTVDMAGFEKINFLLSGGDCGCSGKRGGMPPSVLPMASLDQPVGMSSSMMTSMSQPLSANVPFLDTMTFPSSLGHFSPSLTNY